MVNDWQLTTETCHFPLLSENPCKSWKKILEKENFSVTGDGMWLLFWKFIIGNSFLFGRFADFL